MRGEGRGGNATGLNATGLMTVGNSWAPVQPRLMGFEALGSSLTA